MNKRKTIKMWVYICVVLLATNILSTYLILQRVTKIEGLINTRLPYYECDGLAPDGMYFQGVLDSLPDSGKLIIIPQRCFGQ